MKAQSTRVGPRRRLPANFQQPTEAQLRALGLWQEPVGALRVEDPNRPLVRKLAADFCNANAGLIADLYGRWLDESQYEDIKDYLSAFVKNSKKFSGVNVHGVTKRPFGFLFSATVNAYTVEYKVTAQLRKIKWGPVC